MQSKKVIALISVIVVLALLISGTAYITKGFKEWDPRNWFPEKEKDEDEALAVDGGGNSLYPGKVYKMSDNMTFLGVTAGEGITLEATVLPEDATDKTVDWSLSWINSSSLWASGKDSSDYVIVTPLSDGSNLASVSCINANGFSEGLHITVSLRRDPEIRAQCTVDFQQRFIDCSYSLTVDSVPVGKPYSIDINTDNKDYLFEVIPSVTDGTISLGTLSKSVTVRFDSDVWAVMMGTFGLPPFSPVISLPSSSFKVLDLIKDLGAAQGGALASLTNNMDMVNAFASMASGQGKPLLELEYTLSYGATAYANEVAGIYITTSFIPASEITLDNSTIIF